MNLYKAEYTRSASDLDMHTVSAQMLPPPKGWVNGVDVVRSGQKTNHRGPGIAKTTLTPYQTTLLVRLCSRSVPRVHHEQTWQGIPHLGHKCHEHMRSRGQKKCRKQSVLLTYSLPGLCFRPETVTSYSLQLEGLTEGYGRKVRDLHRGVDSYMR